MNDARSLLALSTLRECLLDLAIDFWIQKKELQKAQEQLSSYKLAFATQKHLCPKCGKELIADGSESWKCDNLTCQRKFHISYLLNEVLKPKTEEDGTTTED